VRYGYRCPHVLLRHEGWLINHKKARRIYRELGLQIYAIKAQTSGEGRAECLNTHWFMSLEDARQKDGGWRRY
jgi:hypothetical protein